MAGLCQDCTGCCKVFEVRELSKPFGISCKHIAKTADGMGCGIYNSRPESCFHYVCLWLESQRRQALSDQMPEALRPDVCKVVMGWPWGIERETIHVYPYPEFPNAWREGAVRDHLRMILSRGGKVVVYVNSGEIYAINGDMAVRGTEKEFAELLTHEELV